MDKGSATLFAPASLSTGSQGTEYTHVSRVVECAGFYQDNAKNYRRRLQNSLLLCSPGLCPPHWLYFRSSCYFLSSSSLQSDLKTWLDARKECLKKRADLMKISSDAENSIAGISGTGRWIGLRAYKGVFRWIDNTLVSFHRFLNNITANTGQRRADDKCVFMQGRYWENVGCKRVRMKYVCKKGEWYPLSVCSVFEHNLQQTCGVQFRGCQQVKQKRAHEREKGGILDGMATR